MDAQPPSGLAFRPGIRTTWEPAGADFVAALQRLEPARLDLLAAEKEFTRQRDALTHRCMAMPWEHVEKSYQFEGPNRALSLADLFDGRSQLIVYHFIFGPDWDEGCKSCSFWADNFNGIPIISMAMMLPSLVPMLWRYRQAVGRTGETRLGRLTALVGALLRKIYAIKPR